MSEPVAIYSLPDKNQFYQVYGNVETISRDEVFKKSGFIFAPFDLNSESIYRIEGHPEKWSINAGRSWDWVMPDREVEQTNQTTYKDIFDEGIKAIHDGTLDKIVLSVRETDDNPITSIPHFLQSLREAYPSAFIYLFYIPGKEFWIGASPELLLDNHYPFQRTTALAGTLIQAPKLDQWPEKEREEHRYVELFIEEVLQGMEYRKEGPEPVLAGPVYHLKSTYFLNTHGQGMNPFDLHPGPALSGYPVTSSISKILNIEPAPRRYYTGFLGPVWNEHHSLFYVNLRCLEMLETQLILYAGGGLTIDSDFQTEWAEIKDKMSTLRSKF